MLCDIDCGVNIPVKHGETPHPTSKFFCIQLMRQAGNYSGSCKTAGPQYFPGAQLTGVGPEGSNANTEVRQLLNITTRYLQILQIPPDTRYDAHLQLQGQEQLNLPITN